MANQVYIFVNGIFANPGQLEAWTDRAVTWVQTRTPHRAEKFEYFSDAILRRTRQQYRAERLAHLMTMYNGWVVNLVGHSNGCDVILRALPLVGRSVGDLDLVAAACDANFARNGLNEYLRLGKVKGVDVYCGGKDWAMVVARWTRWLTLGLAGYGDLGGSGPVNLSPDVASKVRVVREPEYGHSEWFGAPQFDKLMGELIARN